MSDVSVKFKIKSINKIMEERGIEPRGKLQMFIDNEVVKQCMPYVPWQEGVLAKSPITASKYGSGEIVYNTPYAAKQYYNNSGNGLRGKMWFERMKADHLDEILDGAAKLAGGEPKK